MLGDAAKRMLHEDLARLSDRADTFTDAVFGRWFAAAPDAARLFPGHGPSTRREMLDATTIAVHDLVEGVSWLRWDLAAFGARHAGSYEVRDQMYAGYLDAILCALRDVLAPDFDDAHEAAWREALERVSGAMRHWHELDRVATILASGTTPRG